MMVLLVLLAVASAVSVVSARCEGKNPFLAGLVASGVSVYTEPQPSTSPVCAHEWSFFQTCCHADKLKAYAQSQAQSHRSAYQEAKDELQQASTALMNAFREFSNLESSISQCESIADLSLEITKFKKQTSIFFSVTEQQLLLEQQCFVKTEKIRNYVLCYTCSGRSEIFFEGGKARISLEDCKGIIDECSFLWNRAIQLIDTLDLAQEIVAKLKKTFPTTVGLLNFGSAANLRYMIDSMNLRSTTSLCSTSSAPTCDATSAKAVCESMVSLHQKGFVENALQAVKKEVALLPSLSQVTQSINTQVVETIRISQETSSKTMIGGVSTTNSVTNLCSATSTRTVVSAATVTPTSSSSWSSSTSSLSLSSSSSSSSATTSTTRSGSDRTQSLWGLGLRRLYTAPTGGSCGDTQIIVNPPSKCVGCIPISGCADCP